MKNRTKILILILALFQLTNAFGQESEFDTVFVKRSVGVNEETFNDYPKFISTSRIGNTLTIDVAIIANCCHNFLGEAEVVGKDTLNLVYTGYGGFRQQGREIYYEIELEKMKEIDIWLEKFRKIWEDRFNQLDNVLNNLKSEK